MSDYAELRAQIPQQVLAELLRIHDEYGFGCSAHSEGLECCMDMLLDVEPRVFRTVEYPPRDAPPGWRPEPKPEPKIIGWYTSTNGSPYEQVYHETREEVDAWIAAHRALPPIERSRHIHVVTRREDGSVSGYEKIDLQVETS